MVDVPTVGTGISYVNWYCSIDWAIDLRLISLESDIIYVNAGGTEMVILNTLEAITDLLEKRGSIYSGR